MENYSNNQLGAYRATSKQPNLSREHTQISEQAFINTQTLLTNNNRLLTIATPLLTLLTQIRHTADQQHVARFRIQIIEEIKTFTQQIAQAGYDKSIIMAARYCLCTALDEAVLGQPWGTKSIWVQECLLSYFHKETWGGENFYVIVHNMAKEPRMHIDFLEFAYALLSLGFEGKFFDKQSAVREDIRNRLFYRIRNARNKPDRTLSPHHNFKIIAEKSKTIRKTVKRLTLFSLSGLLLINISFNVLTKQHAKGTLTKLDALATVSPVTEFSQIIDRPIVARGNKK